MQETIKNTENRLSGLRTNRANPELLSHVKVNYYGSSTPLTQLASISTPEAKLFLLNIYDNNAIEAIEKAIMASNLGLTPQVDGATIKIRLPELTEERRQEMVKVLSTYCEEAKVSIRNIRRNELDRLKKEKQNKEKSEDEINSEQTTIQKTTDRYIKVIDDLKINKEQLLLNN